MNKVKKISVFLLLLIMTVCIVFLPQLLNEQNEERLLNKKIHWDYNMRNTTKITSNQVAELYYNREIGIGVYNDVSLDIENYEPSLIQEKSFELFETVFENNEPICEHIKMMIINGTLHYSQSSTLIKLDNQPIALNFIVVVITSSDGTFEFVYEEKTKTLISLSCVSLSYYLNYEQEETSLIASLELAVKSYYENQLQLGANEYYCSNELVDKDAMKEYYTEFGILQCPIDVKEK